MDFFKKNWKPLFYLTRIFGLLHFNSSRKTVNCFLSIPYFAYHIILLAFEVFFFYDHLSKRNIDTINYKQITFILICFLKLTIDYFWFISKSQQIILLLSEIEVVYNKMPIKLDSKQFKYQITMIFLTIGLTLLMIHSINFKYGYKPLTTWAFEVITYSGVINYFLYVVLNFIKQFFITINNKINGLDITKPDAILIIKEYTKMHLTLTELARKLNSLFSIPILGNTIIIFVLNITVTYKLVLRIHFNSTISDTLHAIKYTLLLIYMNLQIILMIHSWDSIPHNAKETGLLLYKLSHYFPNIEEIDTLCLVLLQNKLKFTICRFADLNWSLMHLIIQSTSMYLVWLIQLKS